MDRVVIIGGGGHATVVLDLLALLGRFSIVGCIDKTETNRLSHMGIPFLGTDEDLERLPGKGVNKAVMGLAGFDMSARHSIFERARSAGLEFPVLIHPRATVAASCILGPGTVVMAGAVLNPGVRVGCNVIVNTAAVVEHDCWVGDSVHLAPGSVVCGGVTIGNRCFIGARACIIQSLSIGENALVAAGAVVISHVPDGQRVCGVPARPMLSGLRSELGMG